jgi:hypothetical protein
MVIVFFMHGAGDSACKNVRIFGATSSTHQSQRIDVKLACTRQKHTQIVQAVARNRLRYEIVSAIVGADDREHADEQEHLHPLSNFEHF